MSFMNQYLLCLSLRHAVHNQEPVTQARKTVYIVICQSYMHVNPEVYDRGFSLELSAYNNLQQKGDSLLLLPESKETDTRDLDDLESDTGNISLCLSSSTETRDKNFVVLVGLYMSACACDQQGRQHTKLRQPSLGTKAVTFFPFLMS
jgi:hypothetical protein